MHRSRVLALSLVELLVVVAVIGVLAGLLAAGVMSSRRGAIVTEDIAHLRQLAVALAMYESAQGPGPLAPGLMADRGLVPRELVVSRADRTPRGWANYWADQPGSSRAGYPFRVSYPGLMDEAFGDWAQWVLRSSPSSGWAVTFAASESMGPIGGGMYRGTFHRLTFDGGVIARRHGFETRNGVEHLRVASWFTDAWRELEPPGQRNRP